MFSSVQLEDTARIGGVYKGGNKEKVSRHRIGWCRTQSESPKTIQSAKEADTK